MGTTLCRQRRGVTPDLSQTVRRIEPRFSSDLLDKAVAPLDQLHQLRLGPDELPGFQPELGGACGRVDSRAYLRAKTDPSRLSRHFGGGTKGTHCRPFVFSKLSERHQYHEPPTRS
jgi:hypothetical protein